MEWIRLDGTLTVSSTFTEGDRSIMLERIYFPSPTRPAVCEKYTLTNAGVSPVLIEIPAVRNETVTAPEQGTEGSYRLIAATLGSTDRSYRLMPGESVSFSASVQGLKNPQGEIRIAETLYPLITWSLEYCRRNLDGNGVVRSTADELELRFPAGDANLCTSSLYYDALLSAAWLEEEMDREYRKKGGPGKEDSAARAESYREQAATLRKNIERHFGCDMKGFETYRYYEGNDLLRSWICIPLVMDIFDRKEGTVSALLSPALWSENGVYTEEGTDVFWDRATLYALRGIYASGYREKATSHLLEYSGHRLLGEHVPYAVEAWPEGNQRHLSTESALYCRVFTEGMFGFRPTGFSSFTLRPQLPDGWDRMELRGIHACSEQPFDIKVRRTGEKLYVTISRDGKVSAKYRVSNGEQFSVDMESL